jgi:hypothetical protein
VQLVEWRATDIYSIVVCYLQRLQPTVRCLVYMLVELVHDYVWNTNMLCLVKKVADSLVPKALLL